MIPVASALLALSVLSVAFLAGAVFAGADRLAGLGLLILAGLCQGAAYVAGVLQ